MKINFRDTLFEAQELIDSLCKIMGVEMITSLVRHVRDNNMLTHLFEAAISPERFSEKQGDRLKIGFHAAWVLEVYLAHFPDDFDPFVARFAEAFPDTKNESAKRHFCKIMNQLLTENRIMLHTELAERMVEACGDWIMNPKSKIAVRLGAIEIIAKLRGCTHTANEIFPVLIEQMKENASPALWARMRQWREMNC